MTVRAKLNRLGLEMVGDISWPEHVAIFTTPFRMTADLRIPLIMYGENPQDQYGGPQGSEQAKTMTQRWRSEFGGFLGLRPADMVGQLGITSRDMEDYRIANTESHVEAHFLGAYLPWDSHHNAEVARQAGMQLIRDKFGIAHPPAAANLWPAENLDNAQTGLHDHMMWRKYGYGRGCAQASVDIRSGMASRSEALTWVLSNDSLFPNQYACVVVEEVLDRIGMTREKLNKIMDQFTNWEIMRRVEDDANATPILIG
jgi:hypothetical protein